VRVGARQHVRAEAKRADDGASVIEVEPWSRQRDRRALLLLVLGVWVVYLATASYTNPQVTDNRAVNISAWSLATRGTLALPDHFEGQNRWVMEGRDGALYTDRLPGAVLWATPFHAAAEAIDPRGEPDHVIFINRAPGGVAAATVTALAVGATFVLFRRLAQRRLAVAASLVLALCTGVWSVSADSMWTHGLMHLTLVLALLATASERYARSGLAFAAAILTRPHAAMVAATVGLWEGCARRSVRPVLAIGLGSSLGLLGMAIYSQLLFGTWLPIAGYETEGVRNLATTTLLDTLERLAVNVGHPQRGALVYAPFLLVLLPFVGRGWRASPVWARSSAVGGLVYFVVQLRFTPVGGSGFFGSRLVLETLVLAAPLLLRTWQVAPRSNQLFRRAALALVAVSLAMHTLGATLLSAPGSSRDGWTAFLEGVCEEVPDARECP
jgi:hypothetical protein